MNEPTEQIIEHLGKYPHRWHVSMTVASEAGIRESHHSMIVNAPDQLAAVAVAFLKEWEKVTPKRWSEVHILVTPLLPNDLGRLLTPEDIVNRVP